MRTRFLPLVALAVALSSAPAHASSCPEVIAPSCEGLLLVPSYWQDPTTDRWCPSFDCDWLIA